MKQIIKLCYVTILLFTLGLISCSKDDGDDTATFFKCKIDGVKFETSGLLAYATTFSNDYAIYGVKANGDSFYMSLAENKKTGTFNAKPNEDVRAYYVKTGVSDSFTTIGAGASGSITITKNDGVFAEGTFSFIMENNAGVKINVTEGSFKVKFR